MLQTHLGRRFAATPLLLLLLLGSVLAFVACGGDDDDGGTALNPNGERTDKDKDDEGAASSDSNDTKDDAKTNAGTGDDKPYAKSLCVSLDAYLAKFLDEAGKDPELLTNQEKTIKVAGPILDDLAKNLSKAKPPKDMAKYHDELVKNVRDVAKKANDGTITSLDQFSDISANVEEPPQDVQDRLSKAARDTPECADSLLGGDLFSDQTP